MAITLSKVYPEGNGRTRYSGTYTHTLGAAPETFTVGNGRVRKVEVVNFDSGAKHEITRFTESVSGGTNTVTVLRDGDVADGRIDIVVDRA